MALFTTEEYYTVFIATLWVQDVNIMKSSRITKKNIDFMEVKVDFH